MSNRKLTAEDLRKKISDSEAKKQLHSNLIKKIDHDILNYENRLLRIKIIKLESKRD